MPPDPNAPQPGEPIIFARFDGLKNTLLPERMSPRDLQRAVNIDLDDVGQMRRRRGVTKKIDGGNPHSLFTVAQGDITIGVLNGSIGVLGRDYTFTALRPIITSPSAGMPPLSYAQVGRKVYYSGQMDSGIVDLTVVGAPTVTDWGSERDLWLSPVVNPTTNLPAIGGKLLGKPPNATSLAYLNGRIYLAQGSILWSTQPWLYNFVDKTAGFRPFEGQITMLGAVSDGIYVGTDESLYFLTAPAYIHELQRVEMKKTQVMDSAVIPGSMVLIPSELGNPPQINPIADTPLQVSVAFMTTSGFCMAQNSGQVYNLTENKFFFPDAQSAAAMYRRQDGVNQFVAVLQSGGTPAHNAAIGDYVEATIIRGGGVSVPGGSFSGGSISTDEGDELLLEDGTPLII